MAAPCDIHSLPIETLSEIFRTTVAAATPRFWATMTRALHTELERIANAPLLILSQGCSRWHEIAINNSSFWSTIEVDSLVGGNAASSVLERTIRLLNARLQRSRDAPLSVSLFVVTQPFHPRIFHLLAQYSHRWESLDVAGFLRGVETSVLRGRLPRLKKLSITSLFGMAEALASAPRLEILCLIAPLVQTPFFTELSRLNPPRTFQCMVLLPKHSGAISSLIPNLPATTDVELAVNIDSAAFRQQCPSLEGVCLPTITGSISTLACTALEEFNPDDMSLILDHLFACLTVRRLQRLTLTCRAYPRLVFEWPHRQFLALCERSDLGRSVTMLRIAEVHISQDDLLETLSVLEVLKHLEVGTRWIPSLPTASWAK